MRIFLAVLAGCLLAPAAASAAVVSREGPTVTVTGTEAGEALSIAKRGGLRTLGDTYRAIAFEPGETYVAGPGCTQARENDVECPVEGVTQIVIVGGGGNDKLSAGVTTPDVRLDGGDGDDQLGSTLTAGAQVIDGGAGNDTVRGGGSGGPVSLLGGEGDDELLATSGGATFDGGAGDDRVVVSNPDAVASDVSGGAGNDTLLVSDPGADRVSGGDGDDTIDVNNETDGAHEPDDVSCGAGKDFTQSDAGDHLAADCEKYVPDPAKLTELKVRPAKKKLTLRFKLDRPAKLRIVLQRRKAGRFKKVRTVTRRFDYGRDHLVVRRLKPGRYRAAITTITVVRKSRPTRVSFTVRK